MKHNSLRLISILKFFLLLNLLWQTGTVLAQSLPDEIEVSAIFVAIPMDSALLLLSKESGVNISYDPTIIPSEKKVSTAAGHLNLGLVLDDILYGTSLIYRIVGNQLIITKNPSERKTEKISISG